MSHDSAYIRGVHRITGGSTVLGNMNSLQGRHICILIAALVDFEQLQALHLADVARVLSNTRPSGKIPQPDRPIVRSREQHLASLDLERRVTGVALRARCVHRVPEFHCIHPVPVATQGERLARVKVPHLDRRVDAPASKNVGIEVEADDAVGVSGQRSDAFAFAPVPHTDGVVHAAGDQLCLVELQASHGTGVTPQTAYLDTRLEVPYADGAIIRASDENREGWMGQRLAELETHDAIRVTSQCMELATSATPVPFDGETFTVDVFPWARDRLWVEGSCVGRSEEIGVCSWLR